MSIKLMDEGGQEFLNVLFGATVKPTVFTVQLLTDAVALADADIYTTHTVATGGGYVDKTMANDATVALSADNIPEATWLARVWTFTGALTGNPSITGYQVLSGTKLLFAEKLVTAFTPANNGDQLTITPKFKLGNGTPT
jgi:hypothetical protein